MGKPSGFMEYEREANNWVAPLERIKNFEEFKMPRPLEERKIQAARCMNCGVPFCQAGEQFGGMYSGCPLHNLIPEWNDEIYRGDMKEAYERLKKTNNFPEFTGRVCPALCEAACTCGLNDEPVTCHDNELSVIEEAFAKGYIQATEVKIRSGKKVAVIGAGPAGLTAAYELLSKKPDEYSVTVLEGSSEIGGISRTVKYKGNRMDIGGHRFFSKVPEVNEWWEKMLPLQGAPSFDDVLLKRDIPLSENGGLYRAPTRQKTAESGGRFAECRGAAGSKTQCEIA